MAVSIDIRGANATSVGLEKWGMRARVVMRESVIKSVKLIKKDAGHLVSHGRLRAIDTGKMRRSIKTQLAKDTSVEIIGEVMVEVPYSVYVHEGTYKMTARPFLATALRRQKGNIKRIIVAAYRRIA